MWIRPGEVNDHPKLRFVVQTLLRVHGFVWHARDRLRDCSDIYQVRIRGNRMTVVHTMEGEVVRTVVHWTRMNLPLDLDSHRPMVHIREWPPGAGLEGT
jgi:hypothetical protein